MQEQGYAVWGSLCFQACRGMSTSSTCTGRVCCCLCSSIMSTGRQQHCLLFEFSSYRMYGQHRWASGPHASLHILLLLLLLLLPLYPLLLLLLLLSSKTKSGNIITKWSYQVFYNLYGGRNFCVALDSTSPQGQQFRKLRTSIRSSIVQTDCYSVK